MPMLRILLVAATLAVALVSADDQYEGFYCGEENCYDGWHFATRAVLLTYIIQSLGLNRMQLPTRSEEVIASLQK